MQRRFLKLGFLVHVDRSLVHEGQQGFKVLGSDVPEHDQLIFLYGLAHLEETLEYAGARGKDDPMCLKN